MSCAWVWICRSSQVVRSSGLHWIEVLVIDNLLLELIGRRHGMQRTDGLATIQSALSK